MDNARKIIQINKKLRVRIKLKNNLLRDADKLIIKRRRKRLYRRSFLIILLLVSALAVLCFKLPYFNVRTVTVVNNNNVSGDEIVKLSNISKGSNIFYLSLSLAKENIMRNPYVLDVNIKRSLPGTVIINVKEREADYYNKINNKFLVIDGNGMVLETRDSLGTMKLIKLDGFDYTKATVGQKLPSEDENKIKILRNLSDLLASNVSNIKATSVDISSIYDLKVYFNDMCVKLGDGSNLKDKLNKALDILKSNDLKASKGYIDTSFDGAPVLFIDK